jgi:hypothetical protein
MITTSKQTTTENEKMNEYMEATVQTCRVLAKDKKQFYEFVKKTTGFIRPEENVDVKRIADVSFK